MKPLNCPFQIAKESLQAVAWPSSLKYFDSDKNGFILMDPPMMIDIRDNNEISPFPFGVRKKSFDFDPLSCSELDQNRE